MINVGMMLPLLPLLVGLPLIAAIACVVIRSTRGLALVSALFAVAQLLVVTLLLLAFQDAADPWRYTLGGWGAPLGIDLAVDGLALVLLLTTAILVLVLSFYSVGYFVDAAKRSGFWPLWWLLVAGLNAAFIAADAFNIYVALEIIGLAAAALVALAGTPTALSAALRYALVGLLGSLCYLLGVALLYRAYGTLDLAQLGVQAQADSLTWAALALISGGLLLKTALLPLHFWLPAAHASAPVPVSAVLSALVVKASFYLLLRFWLEVLTPATTELAANFLGLLGAAAIFWGCLAALRARRLKLLVAYSTVAQLGYLFLLFPLALTGNLSAVHGTGAVVAVTYFIIAHALAKAAMFLAAGNILAACGHDELRGLRGLACYQPLPLLVFAIAGVSLIGLPPSGGFIAKWLLLNAAISSGQWWWVVVILAGGLLAALYIARMLNIAFSQVDADRVTTTIRPVPRVMTLCGLVLALLAVLLGVNAEWLIALLDSGNAAPQPVTAGGAL